MGDFSRNTFELTNILHQLLTKQVVTNPRHYVAVRLQQGVPLLDSDWNELEDLRRFELQALARLFVGNGVPAGDDGFRISASGDTNNLSIHPGVILVGGMLVINPATTTYQTQAEQAGLSPLTVPTVDRNDMVFLDVWHDEIAGAGGPDHDERLVNNLVRVETAVRIRRRWQVRVKENARDIAAVLCPLGHTLLPLALLRRRVAAQKITDDMIIERRITGLTVSNNLKVPLDMIRGADHVDSARFARMLHTLRIALFQRLCNGKLPYKSVPPKESYLMIALQDLMNTARAGETMALSGSVSESDGLAILKDLYYSQRDWLTNLANLGNVDNVAKPFIDDYNRFLQGEPGTGITGLLAALVAADLVGAVLAQEALNGYLGSPVNVLPEGCVIVVYRLVAPFSSVASGTPFMFMFDITAQFISPSASETFLLDASLPADFGTATPAQSELTFAAGDTPTTHRISITVNPSGTASRGALQVTAHAVRNTSLRSTQQPLVLIRGTSPPAPAVFFYVGQTLNAAGQLPLTQNQLTSAGCRVEFMLRNDSATDNHSYEVTAQVALPPSTPTAGWLLEPVVWPLETMTANSGRSLAFTNFGPKPPAQPPALNLVGTIVATAVLTQINGASPPTPQSPIVVSIPFIVV